MIQALAIIYVLYLMIKFNKPRNLIAIFAVVVALFIWLKFEIIEYELTSDYDKFLWGSYNLLMSWAFIYLLSYESWNKRKEYFKNLTNKYNEWITNNTDGKS